MDKINENISVTQKDISFIEAELTKSTTVPTLNELTEKLAFKKNASQLNQEVKKFDPDCKYEIGDLICKHYDEPLLVSSKGAAHFKGNIVLKVINKIAYDSFNCEMLEVDFTGGGVFRRHIDYMKKTKTQVLLPSSLEGKAQIPETLKREDDPRLCELPMTEKDLRTLGKNLSDALSHSDAFFSWNNHWQLTDKKAKIAEKTVKKIETKIKATGHSLETTEIIADLFSIPPTDDNFDLYCLSLNHTLDKKYKKTFIFMSPEKWGKWFLRGLLDSYLKKIPLTASMAKLPPIEPEKKPILSAAQKFPLKVYLTWREILSGGMCVPHNLIKELSPSREYQFTDAESEEQYIVHFYPNKGIFLGLSEFYQKNNVTQGASLTLEKSNLSQVSFWLKKSKKKLSVPFVKYESKNDRFIQEEKEILTSCLPNKIIFLDNETLNKLSSLSEQRDNLDLRELLILMFKNFGLEGEALSLHYLRAFHLVDMIRHTSLEDIESVLLNSHEFFPSEKKKGLFLYQEKVKAEKSVIPEESIAEVEGIPHEEAILEPDEDLPAIGTVGEIETPTVILEEKVGVEIPLEKEAVEAEEEIVEPPPQELEIEKKPKEKEPKKKKRKIKADVEKGPRRRRGERKLIEEKIELEESELEALFAVKAKEKEEVVEEKIKPAKEEKKVVYKAEEPEEPMTGVFGDMLKSALGQKKAEKKPEAKTKPPKAKKSPVKKATKKKSPA